MNAAILSMLGRYQCITVQDYENVLKEIMQEIALLGLWRSKFFEHAAFYGGTALRILYGLDRFSEDLDFSLLKPQKDFTLAPYLNAVKAELNGMGFDVAIEEKNKGVKTAIESAFIKAGTKEHLIKIAVSGGLSDRIQKNKLMTVKFEVDTDPPGGFQTEVKTLLQPIPFSVHTYKLPDLFAGKLHALLHRAWKSRVKGRDYYDFVWYLVREIPVRLSHLEQRLRQSGLWTSEQQMQLPDLLELLEKKFAELDITAVKKSVSPFLRDPAVVDLWSREFFLSILSRLKVA
ncbi:MAG: nucleotidyl transferase AbiEii/AbiGii toxin family protein [Candidatus Melainabacteria bacterium]|nr:nucleotidyl transferase AbiEii/AbiGii toxin family protein [Candidatus Melainabacteria bacterium]